MKVQGGRLRSITYRGWGLSVLVPESPKYSIVNSYQPEKYNIRTKKASLATQSASKWVIQIMDSV